MNSTLDSQMISEDNYTVRDKARPAAWWWNAKADFDATVHEPLHYREWAFLDNFGSVLLQWLFLENGAFISWALYWLHSFYSFKSLIFSHKGPLPLNSEFDPWRDEVGRVKLMQSSIKLQVMSQVIFLLESLFFFSKVACDGPRFS